jgi:putative transposase
MTTNPNSEWMKQQARNLCVFFADEKVPPEYIIHDADTKFTRDFRELLKQNGIKAVRIGPRSPNMNAIAERFVKTVKEECLSHFITFSEGHLRHLLMTFLNYYHTKRTHRGLDYLTPKQVENGETSVTVELIERSELVRKTAFGGVLKWYERRAA